MNINIHNVKGIAIAEILSDNIEIKNTQDALDLMADCGYHEARHIILYEKNIASEFFELKTGLAGEILQKFSTYNVKLAIIGDYSKYQSNSLKNFIYESNRFGRINFVNSIEEAKECLVKGLL